MAQSQPPSYRSQTCNALCDLVTAIKTGAPSVRAEAPANPPAEPAKVAALRAPVKAASLPMTRSQLHLVAGAAVTSLRDLDGKSVSLGLNGSDSQKSARFVFRRAGINVHEVPLDLDNALDALGTGVVDGVFVMAPEPQKVLAGIPARAGLHFVPIASDKAGVTVARVTRPAESARSRTVRTADRAP